MEFKANKIKTCFKTICLLQVFLSAAESSVDCVGKPFHCLNVTHFTFCVDIGNGIMIAVTELSIPCPTGFECHTDNNYGCEIFRSTTSVLSIQSEEPSKTTKHTLLENANSYDANKLSKNIPDAKLSSDTTAILEKYDSESSIQIIETSTYYETMTEKINLYGRPIDETLLKFDCNINSIPDAATTTIPAEFNFELPITTTQLDNVDTVSTDSTVTTYTKNEVGLAEFETSTLNVYKTTLYNKQESLVTENNDRLNPENNYNKFAIESTYPIDDLHFVTTENYYDESKTDKYVSEMPLLTQSFDSPGRLTTSSFYGNPTYYTDEQQFEGTENIMKEVSNTQKTIKLKKNNEVNYVTDGFYKDNVFTKKNETENIFRPSTKYNHVEEVKPNQPNTIMLELPTTISYPSINDNSYIFINNDKLKTERYDVESVTISKQYIDSNTDVDGKIYNNIEEQPWKNTEHLPNKNKVTTVEMSSSNTVTEKIDHENRNLAPTKQYSDAKSSTSTINNDQIANYDFDEKKIENNKFYKDKDSTIPTHLTIDCTKHVFRKYADEYDCRKFYMCEKRNEIALYYCLNNTVYSEIENQCTKNLSHCVRNNKFICVDEGRFRDYFQSNAYYVCAKRKNNRFARFKFKCQIGYYLDAQNIKCVLNVDPIIKSKNTINEGVNMGHESTSSSSTKLFTTQYLDTPYTTAETNYITKMMIATASPNIDDMNNTTIESNYDVINSTVVPSDNYYTNIILSNGEINPNNVGEHVTNVTHVPNESSSFPLITTNTPMQKRPNELNPLTFQCIKRDFRKYSDNVDCRKYYMCTSKNVYSTYYCPNNTIYSEMEHQCTSKLSHCVRQNKFICISEGRFSDYFHNNVYYICVRSKSERYYRFQFQCQKGYYLEKQSVKCALNNTSNLVDVNAKPPVTDSEMATTISTQLLDLSFTMTPSQHKEISIATESPNIKTETINNNRLLKNKFDNVESASTIQYNKQIKNIKSHIFPTTSEEFVSNILSQNSHTETVIVHTEPTVYRADNNEDDDSLTDNYTTLSNEFSTNRNTISFNESSNLPMITTNAPPEYLQNPKNESTPVTFNCTQNYLEKYSDKLDCRIYYMCTTKTVFTTYYCPKNTVFSEIENQCTAQLSHCVRQNKFICVAEGRFSDYFQNNVYYICVKSKKNKNYYRFQFQCQNGYYLDKQNVKCMLKNYNEDREEISYEQDDEVETEE